MEKEFIYSDIFSAGFMFDMQIEASRSNMENLRRKYDNL